ncbi:MAG: retroviral-like aspartic protease family protein [Sphingopyxis sp.]|uniref:retroviral-like aspartic protease family protein n=1 Tax=Sphingopyxis sp. TaxID=1908224 RepID=UPI002ABB551F|nr:retroviral-like aspartic protease family protein [Sphingopyxis sp.]MDZ3832150.1 retroviral-like aspartic protease family protein [Sphingopyxis sp.]
MLHAVSRSRRRWAALLLAPLFVGAAPPAAAQSSAAPVPPAAAPDVGTSSEVVPIIQPFDLDATRRMSVPVTVEGQGPFSFLVDTGAERTVIAKELAERLGLANGQKLRLATIGSSAIVPSFQVASLEMTNLRLQPFDAPAFAGRHIGAPGLIGVDMLEERRVLIDFRSETMQILETRRRARPMINSYDAIVVSARNSAGRLILSDARIGGKRIDVIVDTGAQTSIGNPALQQLVMARRENRFPLFPTTLNAVSGEAVPAVRTAIKTIEINGVNLNDLPISFTDAQAFRALGLADRPAMLLGMDGLAVFDRIEIDFPNKRVIFDLPKDAGSQPLMRPARGSRLNG